MFINAADYMSFK